MTAAARPSEGADRPPAPPAVVLFVSVLAMSTAAPLVRFATTDPLAISFWRLALALPVIAILLTVRGEWAALRRLGRREWLISILAGVLLAFHFWSWVASLSLTSVAASVALVSTQPVWVALFAMVTLREQPEPRQWMGIAVAVLGAAVIGWGDLSGGPDPIRGDALALAGAFFVAGYYVIGRRLRRGIGLWPYVFVVYGCAAAVLLIALLITGVPIVAGHDRHDWLVFLGLALIPTMIGHTGQNWALRYLPAYAVNLTLLGEPVGATLLAWVLPGIRETPPLAAVAGGVMILSGIVIGMRRK